MKRKLPLTALSSIDVATATPHCRDRNVRQFDVRPKNLTFIPDGLKFADHLVQCLMVFEAFYKRTWHGT